MAAKTARPAEATVKALVGERVHGGGLAGRAISGAPFFFALVAWTVGGCGLVTAPSAAVIPDATAGAEEIDGGQGADSIDAQAVDSSPVADEAPGDAYAEAPALDSTAVRGTVLDRLTRRPLRGRSIAIAGKTTTTDDNGAFAIGSVAPVYDVTIIEPNLSRVSVYRGLSRRDPVLAHRSADMPDPALYLASVSGTLSGAGSYPLDLSDLVVVYFFSDAADGHALVGGSLPAVPRGPDYGPITLQWNRAGAVAGQLVALGSLSTAGDGGHATWMAHKTLSVASGQAPVVNLTFAQVAERNVAGGIQVPAGESVGFKTVSYRLPIANADINLVTDEDLSSSFGYVLPDLGDVGGELCMTAGSSSGSVTLRCGIVPGAGDVSLTVQASPSFTALADGSTIATDTPIAFTQFDGGMHELEFHSTVSAPSIDVFTVATTVSPADLASAGAALVAGTSYACRITGLGPFGTMDDVVGKDGLSAAFPAEQRQSPSRPIQLTFMP